MSALFTNLSVSGKTQVWWGRFKPHEPAILAMVDWSRDRHFTQPEPISFSVQKLEVKDRVVGTCWG